MCKQMSISINHLSVSGDTVEADTWRWNVTVVNWLNQPSAGNLPEML